MKKVALAIVGGFITGLILAISSCGYNKQIIDLDYNFNKAIIKDIGTVNVKSWNDYENSDMIQVTDTSGKIYMTHSSNVILIHE